MQLCLIQHIARCASGGKGASIAYDILSEIYENNLKGIQLRLQWIPSYIGIRGNEETDILARKVEVLVDGKEAKLH